MWPCGMACYGMFDVSESQEGPPLTVLTGRANQRGISPIPLPWVLGQLLNRGKRDWWGWAEEMRCRLEG
jgi:hypothetical protein